MQLTIVTNETNPLSCNHDLVPEETVTSEKKLTPERTIVCFQGLNPFDNESQILREYKPKYKYSI